jgi:hypothetical protein
MVSYQNEELTLDEQKFLGSLTSDKLGNFEVVVFLGSPRTITSKKTGQKLTVFSGKLKYKGREICNIDLFENIAKTSGKKYLSGKGTDIYVASEKEKITNPFPYPQKTKEEEGQSEKDINFEDIPF